LIQLSTPIQTAIPVQNVVSEPEGSHVEGLSDDSPDDLGQIAEKKNGPGIFAKLLESLTSKSKTAESEDAEDAGGKLPPEAELQNTSHQFLPERVALSVEQTIEQTIGLSFEQSIDQPGDLPITPLIEPGIWARAEEALLPDDSETIDGDLRLMEALLAQDHPALQIEGEEVAPKGREVHREVLPGEMVFKDEGPAEGGESALASLPEAEEEGQLLAAEVNEDIASSVAKKEKAPNYSASSSSLIEEELSHVKYRTASLDAKPAGENMENSQAAKSKSKKGRERVNVEFLDLRTEGPMETGNARGAALNAQGQAPPRPELEISVDLGPKAGEAEGEKAGSGTFQGRAFEDALARELRGDLSADIVRDATIIARNGGEGTIRLTLHPASLGNVKVRLEMAENKITALIVVESDEALKAFQRELPVLEKAFRDSGFSETNLQMSLSQDGGNSSGSQEREERDFSALASIAASRYDAETEWVEALPPVNGETGLSAWPERIPVNLLI
jgi:flagellar hook-length control protein FliK